jgi:hypothetical protein
MAEEESRERRSHNFHTVHFHELPVSRRIHALPFVITFSKLPWRHVREVAVCE